MNNKSNTQLKYLRKHNLNDECALWNAGLSALKTNHPVDIATFVKGLYLRLKSDHPKSLDQKIFFWTLEDEEFEESFNDVFDTNQIEKIAKSKKSINAIEELILDLSQRFISRTNWSMLEYSDLSLSEEEKLLIHEYERPRFNFDDSLRAAAIAHDVYDLHKVAFPMLFLDLASIAKKINHDWFLQICKECKLPFLILKKKKNSEYCSDKCRTKFNNNARKNMKLKRKHGSL
jgi:hypothetical protein